MSSAKSKGNTFIHELPLIVNPKQERDILVALDCARQLYNACLGECFRRLNLMRESKSWHAACAMPKGKPKSPEAKARTEAFKTVNERFGFRKYDIESYATECKNACHIGEHLSAHITQKVADRAFTAVHDYSLHLHGKPRFKGKNRFNSIEGKSNTNGIVWKDGEIVFHGSSMRVIWDFKDKHRVQDNAVMMSRIKYCRIVKRIIKGKNRFYVQLILEEKPVSRFRLGKGKVGLDLGPSTIACVSEDNAFLEAFCSELESGQKKIRLIQRKMARSKSANNPDTFNPDGTIKPGKKFIRSQNYMDLKSELAEVLRKQRENRKTLHGALSNRVLAMGDQFYSENVSYRAWQKLFGKSVGFRAPGMFMTMLKRKAESAGGQVIDIPLRNRLSQTCHNCGSVRKKTLNERWHDCECGIHAQRDLYSAFLAMNMGGEGLDICQAKQTWPGVESLLSQAMSGCEQAANSGAYAPESFGLKRRQSCSHGKENPKHDDTTVAVITSFSKELEVDANRMDIP